MGILQKIISKEANQEVKPAGETATAVRDDGRDKLRHASAELAKATDSVADLEARFQRLHVIIANAKDANDALQNAIAADGGVALAAYAAGTASDQPIAKLVRAGENTAHAASVAKDALPNVEARLAAARAQVVEWEGKRFDEAIRFLKVRAKNENARYRDLFKELCKSYDRLWGIAIAVSATGHAEMMTAGAHTLINANGFNMSTGPSHGPSELVTLRHHWGFEDRIQDSKDAWLQARERLLRDPDASLDDILGLPERNKQ